MSILSVLLYLFYFGATTSKLIYLASPSQYDQCYDAGPFRKDSRNVNMRNGIDVDMKLVSPLSTESQSCENLLPWNSICMGLLLELSARFHAYWWVGRYHHHLAFDRHHKRHTISPSNISADIVCGMSC